jgi:pimeloyl-ACP methyl ester carboxylesterase
MATVGTFATGWDFRMTVGGGLQFSERRLTRAGGRIVAWTESGDHNGRPVLRLPGTPGSRIPVRPDAAPWVTRNLRMITTERPGFGVSTRLAGHSFVEHADDLVAVLDHLGIDSLPVVAGSGGAPYLLALMAAHPDRVSAATIVIGMGQVDLAEAEQLIPLNAAFLRHAHARDTAGLRSLLAQAHDAQVADPLAALESSMATAPPADRAIMVDAAFRAAYVRATTEALRQGVDGWVDECLAIAGDWADVRLHRITGSLTWWHSDFDRNAPLSAAQRLVGELSNAELRLWREAGHLTAYRHEEEVLDELLKRAP